MNENITRVNRKREENRREVKENVTVETIENNKELERSKFK